MLLPVYLTLQADPQQHEDFQKSLLDAFFAEIAPAQLKKLNPSGSSEYCMWDKLICSNYLLSKIQLRYCSGLGSLNIAYLPGTVQYLGIVNCGQYCTIDTRQLPRESRCIFLMENNFYGTVDLRTLPAHVVILDLQYNALSGVTALTQLPQSLEVLRVQNNYLRQKWVYYDNLPPSIAHIQIAPQNSKWQPRARALSPERQVDEAVVFEQYLWNMPEQFQSNAYWQTVYHS